MFHPPGLSARLCQVGRWLPMHYLAYRSVRSQRAAVDSWLHCRITAVRRRSGRIFRHRISCTVIRPDHPRVGGEHAKSAADHPRVGGEHRHTHGSSPRGRGTLNVIVDSGRGTLPQVGSSPRGRGTPSPFCGSSPRGRGTLSLSFTPRSGHSRSGSSPRGRGTLVFGPSSIIRTSPRGHTPRTSTTLREPLDRIIPAWAGNTKR